MLQNFFKITVRNLWRNKGFSSINIVGLAIGMASSILILLWVQHEMSYDRFHEKTDRISMLYSRDSYNGKSEVWPRVCSLMQPELKKDYGEVEDAVRVRSVYFLMTAGEKHLNVNGAFADPGFLSVFSFPLLKGNAGNTLDDNHSIVLTNKLAIRLFGNEDPMGKTVRIDSTDDFTVTGVLKDLPANTEMEFEYLLPWTYLRKIGWDKETTWNFSDAPTYVLLKEGASRTAFDAKMKHIVGAHIKEGDIAKREVFTQPLGRIHLYSKSENGQLTGGRITTVRLFATIAAFILLIACINFMNLSTARSEKRAKEAGIRKVVGARRGSLIAQFIGESTVLALISFALAILLVLVSLNGFDQIMGIPLRLDLANPYFWISALGFILFTGLLAGSYPALYFSSARPVNVLKGIVKNGNTLVTPRKILVILQFTFAIVLVICTVIVSSQVRYAQNRDAGYERKNLVYTFTQGDVNKNYELIKHELIGSGAAIAVTKTFSPITRVWGSISGLSWPGSTEADKKFNFLQFAADADFVKTAGARLVKGRDIDIKNYPTDSTAMLLNEAAVKNMRLSDPIGKTVKNENGVNCHVVGVIKDFIMESPYANVEPMVIECSTQGFGAVHFRLNPANSVSDDLARAEKVFKLYNPQYPFDYYFADEFYARKFRDEQREGTLGALFAGLAIFISCLGLFGLAACMAESRIKEIGVRKVLGASVAGITALLSTDFIRLVFISLLIASPIAWFAMDKWLQGFGYRIAISFWIFLASGALAIAIALLTVSYQALRAARANPVRSLRSE
ncbi:MAG TPA: ABC transporter permease [Puia sp.]|nr:ABC transporter permease [Puia sp.]